MGSGCPGATSAAGAGDLAGDLAGRRAGVRDLPRGGRHCERRGRGGRGEGAVGAPPPVPPPLPPQAEQTAQCEKRHPTPPPPSPSRVPLPGLPWGPAPSVVGEDREGWGLGGREGQRHRQDWKGLGGGRAGLFVAVNKGICPSDFLRTLSNVRRPESQKQTLPTAPYEAPKWRGYLPSWVPSLYGPFLPSCTHQGKKRGTDPPTTMTLFPPKGSGSQRGRS